MRDNKFEIKLSNRKKLQIFPLSDIHVGSPQCNYNFLDKWKNVFQGTKSEKIIYLGGDLIDVAKKSLADSAYRQNMTVEEQIDYIIKFFKPVKKYIRGCTIGNHSIRLKKDYDLDAMKIITDILDIPYYKGGIYETLMINEQPFKIYYPHGSKVSAKPHLMLGTAIRATQHIDADLCLYGHCHQGNSIQTYTLNENGYKEKTTVLTGSFLKYKDSYAETMGLNPFPCSFPVVNIDKDCKVNVTYYRSDEL